MLKKLNEGKENAAQNAGVQNAKKIKIYSDVPRRRVNCKIRLRT